MLLKNKFTVFYVVKHSNQHTKWGNELTVVRGPNDFWDADFKERKAVRWLF